MKKLNLLLFTGLVLLFACGTALAYGPGLGDTSSNEATPIIVQDVEQINDAAPVPEPATMLLLGSGLVALGVGARKMKK